MPVSKRTRFEVLRRDNYTCRYCRSSDEALTVDHVLPVALGGTDEPSNLVAACRDCNAGKASTAPTEELVEQVDADAIRWAAARERVVQRLEEANAAAADRRAPFLAAWRSWDHDLSYLPSGWRDTVDFWLRNDVSMDRILEAMEIALPKRHVTHRELFRYMAGIIRNWLREVDEQVRAELDGGDPDGP